ncbi:hypothetical protein OE88DRAFT_842871 [Heliocybe sulcata]|uniref:Uncharacterized protein n=1 Tax=Heliocybe sulcata TaxID=5364 RepID=A0A5C3MQD1_9AGAM|nr:hypothetical protein OE88DRAFT_842871 [Heliocybe sulcata]
MLIASCTGCKVGIMLGQGSQVSARLACYFGLSCLRMCSEPRLRWRASTHWRRSRVQERVGVLGFSFALTCQATVLGM